MYIKELQTLFVMSMLAISCLSGCQVVNIKQQTVDTVITNERSNILTGDTLSETTLHVLSMAGLQVKSCNVDLDECIQGISNITAIQDEQLYSSASELYLAKAIELSKTSDCKLPSTRYEAKPELGQSKSSLCFEKTLLLLDKSIRYSYLYLFETERQPQDRIFDNRQVQVRDFYNHALTKLLVHKNARLNYDPQKSTIKIGEINYKLDFSDYPELVNAEVKRFESSTSLNFSGFRFINRRDGFGSEFIAIQVETQNKLEREYIWRNYLHIDLIGRTEYERIFSNAV